MKKNISLLLAAIVLGGIMPQVSFGYVNPLKSYDLYADTHASNSPRDNIMSEMYYTDQANNSASSDRKSENNNRPPSAVPTTKDGGIDDISVEMPRRRNEYLRESSRKVFSTESGNWTKGPYFYDNPTLESIMNKYRMSNFAGCMQECEAYVKNHPYDTLGFYYLAMSYAKCGQKENAIAAYEKVISLRDNPMIVKYATNGRNCVINNQKEAKCFQNVNKPDLYYPYKEMASEIGLTPVDPQTLIDRNFAKLSEKFSEPVNAADNKDKDGKIINLPFANQDESLDKFINAPYGDGFSPELEEQIRKQQLKTIQEEINRGSRNIEEREEKLQDIKDFDNYKKKSEAEETIKLALADNMDVADIFNSPEYIQNKKELDQIRMMFGDYSASDNKDDISDMLSNLAKDEKNLSPEVIQMMTMQSVMPNIIDIDSKSGF